MSSGDPVVGDQCKFVVPKYGDMTYEEYTSTRNHLAKKCSEIESLKKEKEIGKLLEENQVGN